MQRDRDDREEEREHHERVPPTVGADQRLAEREEDEARERGDESHRGHGPAPLLREREPLGEHGERRLVEHGGHDDSDADPERVKGRQALDLRPREDEQCAAERAGGHERSGAVAIQESSYADTGDS
jgi:hypothetical protein